MRTLERIRPRVVSRATVWIVASSAWIAQAAPVALPNFQDQANPSAFTLDFGIYGGVSSANIASSYISLAIDPAARTAQFEVYEQFVEPLTLPGGISTGDITVTIDQPATGKFDPETGEFQIDDIPYAIYFTGDLSAYGIASPFRLPSSAGGIVAFSTATAGRTEMNWRGEAALPIPSQPGTFLPFSYTCSANGAFALESELTWVMRSNPPRGAIDARQPHALNDMENHQGWDHLDLTFNALPAAALNLTDILVTERGGDGYVPNVMSLVAVNENTLRVMFDEVIEPGAWTEVSIPGLDASEGTICLAALPGDVNGDGQSNSRDYTALKSNMKGRARQLALWQCDLNRDGVCSNRDLQTEADLLSGNGTHDAWRNASLPRGGCGK